MLIQTFTDLCRIYSPSGREENLAKYIQRYLNKSNIPNFQDSYGNVIAKRSGMGEPVLLTAHMDTVEPSQNIKVVNTNGLLKSDGSTILGADNKATVAAILAALPHAKRNLEIVFTRSEETGNFGAVNLDYSKLNSKTGFAFDSAGPLGEIFIASPYYHRIEIEITGRESHAAHPELAINALKIASLAISKTKLGHIDSQTTCNLGVISGGAGPNTIPGVINLVGEIRSFTQSRLNLATNNLQTIFALECQKHTAKLNFKAILENPGFTIPRPKTLYLQNIYKKLGLTPKLVKTYGCFDANIFIQNGINVITSSDGSENNHSTQESISVANLQKLYQIILEIIR